MSPKKGNKAAGDLGEQEVIRLMRCPNCGKKLMALPPGYPLYDVQCTGCMFRAQVKTNTSKPKPVIFGAGWDIINKVMKSGYMIPPLIANFKWEEQEGKGRTIHTVQHREIRFYPFVPKVHLKKHQLSATARRANYWMFNYIDLHKIPYFVVFKK